MAEAHKSENSYPPSNADCVRRSYLTTIRSWRAGHSVGCETISSVMQLTPPEAHVTFGNIRTLLILMHSLSNNEVSTRKVFVSCKTLTKTTVVETSYYYFVPSWQRPMWWKRPASVVVDSATYLFTISSPEIDNVAMSLYYIILLLFNVVTWMLRIKSALVSCSDSTTNQVRMYVRT